jgi:hypothetical protein
MAVGAALSQSVICKRTHPEPPELKSGEERSWFHKP